jgi:tripartite-type tricarboxylate transporter receptor subunit TctC
MKTGPQKEGKMKPVLWIAATFFWLMSTIASHAQGVYPTRPVRLLVPSAPGSSPDFQARIVAQKLSELWSQPVVVENLPGASGNIAAERAAKVPADGYTLLFATFAVLYTNKTLQVNVGYDIERDFDPITQISRAAILLVVHPSLPVHTVHELVAYGRANPGKLRYGSAGSGTSMHLCAEIFRTDAGIEVLHVPYKSAAQMATDLVAGQFEFAFHNAPVVLPHIRAGKLRALGVTTANRLSNTPDLPTMAEVGFPGVKYDGGVGLVAPKGTPAAVIKKISDDSAKALAAHAVREQFFANGLEPVGSTPEAFAAHIKSEIPRWAQIIRRSGAKLD